MIVGDAGHEVVKLVCAWDPRLEGTMLLSDVVRLLASVETEAEFRRKFWATVVLRKRQRS